MSSLAFLSVPAQPTEDKPDEFHAIWGTTVNLANMMKAFRGFIKSFKPKYHITHDRTLGLPTKAVPSPTAVEVLLYKGYLRSMYAASHVTTPSRLKLTAVRLTSRRHAHATSVHLSAHCCCHIITTSSSASKEVNSLVLTITEELSTRGLTTPFPFFQPCATRQLFRCSSPHPCVPFPALDAERTWYEEACSAAAAGLAMCLRWGLARILLVSGGNAMRGLLLGCIR
jgi:hypothetical protein